MIMIKFAVGLLLPSLAWYVAPTRRADEHLQPAKCVSYAGASAIEIAPERFPVLVNGWFLQNRAIQVNDPTRATAIVLDDGAAQLVIVVVESCMLISFPPSVACGRESRS